VQHLAGSGVPLFLIDRLKALHARLDTPRNRRVFNICAPLAAAAITAVSIEHFTRDGWPLRGANPWLVVVATLIFVAAYALKAHGWKRLFARHERPGAHALAAASGAAACTGLALPGRFDDVVRVAVVRRFRGSRVGVGALCLSLVLVGLIDSAAVAPFASVAAAVSKDGAGIQAGLALVAAAGVGAALIVVGLPRLSRDRRLARFRLCRWLHPRCACPLEATKAWLLVSASWSLRALALYVLLAALGVSSSFPLALFFLCATAASTALPIAPAGAATQVGAGAAILVVAGVKTSHAVAFAISAQALVIVAGAAVVVAAAAWEARLRLRPAPVRP
jgi:uncharacterized membrane protein YbhN (UPF0104 family)